MGKNFDAINENAIFYANSQPFRKIDRLYYHDLSEPDMERMINPLFDQTIGEKIAKAEDMDSTAKFIVDPNTRVIRPNPNYDTSIATKNAALLAFDEFHNTGLFDCEPRDIKTMSEVILQVLLTADDFRAIPVEQYPAVKKAAKKAQKQGTKMAKKKVVAKKPANPKYPVKKR